jgi:hypothetical protein
MTNIKIIYHFNILYLPCSCGVAGLPRWQIGEDSPDTVGTGEIKFPGWTKTSTTALWRRGTFKG